MAMVDDADPLTTARGRLAAVAELLAEDGPSARRQIARGRRWHALVHLAGVRAAVDAATVEVIHELRNTPVRTSWEEIGQALGVSKQAARERFAKRVDHPTAGARR